MMPFIQMFKKKMRKKNKVNNFGDEHLLSLSTKSLANKTGQYIKPGSTNDH